MSVSTQHEIIYENLTQDGGIKPTSLVQPLRAAGAQWWATHTGLDWASYCNDRNLRPLVTYLATETPAKGLASGSSVHANLTIAMGRIPGRKPGTYRYGGLDRLELVTEDHQLVASWVCLWFWLSIQDGALPGFLTDPPDDLPARQADLPSVPLAPRLTNSQERERFKWTARETDLNNHVFFLSYLDRGENALANIGCPAPAICEAWYSRPAFLGETMVVDAEKSDPPGQLLRIGRTPEDVCAVMRFGTQG